MPGRVLLDACGSTAACSPRCTRPSISGTPTWSRYCLRTAQTWRWYVSREGVPLTHSSRELRRVPRADALSVLVAGRGGMGCVHCFVRWRLFHHLVVAWALHHSARRTVLMSLMLQPWAALSGGRWYGVGAPPSGLQLLGSWTWSCWSLRRCVTVAPRTNFFLCWC